MRPEFDDRDAAILRVRQEEYLLKHGPRQGHFVRFVDGEIRRISYVWDCYDDPAQWGIQTSKGGSFYLGDGYMSFSGGLDSSIDFVTFKLTDELMEGPAWFFHHDHPMAFNGVDVTVKCPVWESTAKAP